MTEEKSFNTRIRKFLKEQPNSSASNTIRVIAGKNNAKTFNYYFFLDCFLPTIGLIISLKPKNRGYIAVQEFLANNKINRIPDIKELYNANYPRTLNMASRFLAKETIYTLMQVKDLDRLISEFKESNTHFE